MLVAGDGATFPSTSRSNVPTSTAIDCRQEPALPICLALASDGLSTATPHRHVGGAEAVLTIAQNRLTSNRGDWAEDRNFGLPWLDWAQRVLVPAVEIEGEVRQQLRLVPDLIEVVEVTSVRVGGQISISVVVVVREDDSITTARIGETTPANIPGAWYTLIEPITGVVLP